MGETPVNPELGKWRLGDWEFEVTFGYITNLWPAWTTKDPAKNKKKEGKEAGFLFVGDTEPSGCALSLSCGPHPVES